MEFKQILAKFKNILIKSKNAALDIIYPPNFKCIFCGDDIPDYENKPFCDSCEKEDMFNSHANKCRFCDLPLYSEATVCEHCKQNHPIYQKAFCPMIYKDKVKNAILKFKDDNAKYLAKPFAKLIYDYIKTQNITFDAIIPVPSHPSTIKKRGYNQSLLLADELSKLTSVPVMSDVVIKVSQTKAQKKLNYMQRQKNLYASLKTQNSAKIKNKNVLIVDDILTTGATVNAVSRQIKRYVNNIYVACIARTEITNSVKKHKIFKK